MMLDEKASKDLLSRCGIPVNEGFAVRDAGEAADKSRHIGFPVAVKVLSPKIVHKSDLGLVELNICSPDHVSDAYERIIRKARKIDPDASAVVEAMAPQGTEIIIGAKRDLQFGPTVLFGLGGIFVEVFKDVAIRVAPVDKPMALGMIDEVKGSAILKGFRGKKGVDLNALADIIVKTSRLMMDNDNVLELDMNPVMAYEKGAMAVDARVLMKD